MYELGLDAILIIVNLSTTATVMFYSINGFQFYQNRIKRWFESTEPQYENKEQQRLRLLKDNFTLKGLGKITRRENQKLKELVSKLQDQVKAARRGGGSGGSDIVPLKKKVRRW
jgi:cell shape-determining protein MreC